jgi:hypothetical protein
VSVVCLFVGGICDGEWRELQKPGEDWSVYERTPSQPITGFAELIEGIPTTHITLRRETYKPHPFRIGPDLVHLYAPLDWTVSQVFTALLNNYRPAKEPT